MTKFTIRQDNIVFGLWNIFIMMNGLYSAIAYPYFAVNEFPELYSTSLWVLAFSEGMFFIDIALCFFKQDLDEEGNSKFDTLIYIATTYFKNRFPKDLITFIPFGFFSFLDNRLKFLWVIKTLRIGNLNHQISDRVIMP